MGTSICSWTCALSSLVFDTSGTEQALAPANHCTSTSGLLAQEARKLLASGLEKKRRHRNRHWKTLARQAASSDSKKIRTRPPQLIALGLRKTCATSCGSIALGLPQ